MANSPITHIVVHYSATPRGRHHTVEDIDAWHKARGFKKIGYHYVIYLDGTLHKGRQDNEQGAHVLNHNPGTLGICFIGGTDGDPNKGVDTRTPAQTRTLIALIKKLLKEHPGAEVVGHRDMPGANTQCPGFDVIPWWAAVARGEQTYVPPPTRPTDAPVRTPEIGRPEVITTPLPIDPVTTPIAIGGVGLVMWNFFGWVGLGTVALAAIALLFWLFRNRRRRGN